MSPPNFEPTTKVDLNLNIPEPELDKKPGKQPDVITEPKPEPKPAPKPVVNISHYRLLITKRIGFFKKRCTWFVILGCVAILTAGILGIVAIKQHYKLLHKVIMKRDSIINGQLYPELIEVDYDKKITTIKNARSGVIHPADILSDFKQLMVAYKELTSNVCYVDKLTMSFENSLREITKTKKIKPHDFKQVIPSSEPVDERMLRRFAGPDIFRHCRGIPVFWIVDVIPANIMPLPIPPPRHDSEETIPPEPEAENTV